jgi:hypothetical protein
MTGSAERRMGRLDERDIIVNWLRDQADMEELRAHAAAASLTSYSTAEFNRAYLVAATLNDIAERIASLEHITGREEDE